MKKPNIRKLFFKNLMIVFYAIVVLLVFPITIPYITIKDYKKEKRKYYQNYLQEHLENQDDRMVIK